MIRYHLEPGQKPTPEQIREIEEAAKIPIVYDEDSPELTPEMAEKFREARRRKPLPETQDKAAAAEEEVQVPGEDTLPQQGLSTEFKTPESGKPTI